MTEQVALTLTAASVGFVAAIMFCIGNASNRAKKIRLQATPFYDFSEPVARALAAQRAQYVVGALLLVISFLLQVAAVLASSTTLLALPLGIQTWFPFVLCVTVLTLLISGVGALILYKTTMRKVLQLPPPKSQKLE